jgi:hypothetical protein
MEGTADIAVGAMTINFARESVIDFTKAGGLLLVRPKNQSFSLIGANFFLTCFTSFLTFTLSFS